MYYMTVTKDGVDVVRRQQFSDYAAAVESLGRYHQPRVSGSRATLSLITELINGVFARTYGSLIRPESITDPENDPRYHQAAKQDIAFRYDANYTFLIESEAGINDAEALLQQYEDGE